jgi:hypothetical protein
VWKLRSWAGRNAEPLWKWTARVGGLVLIMWLGFAEHPSSSPWLYIAGLAMMGITVTVPFDKSRQNRDD